MKNLTPQERICELIKLADCDEEIEEYLCELLNHFEHGVYLNLCTGDIKKIYDEFTSMLEEEIPNITTQQKNAILFRTIEIFWLDGGK